jgi:hypothetical protein
VDGIVTVTSTGIATARCAPHPSFKQLMSTDYLSTSSQVVRLGNPRRAKRAQARDVIPCGPRWLRN